LSFQEKFKDINEVIISWSQSEFMLKERANHLSFLNNLLYSISRIWTIYEQLEHTTSTCTNLIRTSLLYFFGKTLFSAKYRTVLAW
jgi:hypothetical protein